MFLSKLTLLTWVLTDLEAKLQESQDCRTRLIATDGVFSMDGNVAPLPEICDLAEKYDALVFIDECHATGFLGETGRGTEEFFGLPPGRVDIINSTLGKALGGAAGGYTCGSKHLVDLLRQRARPYLFSNSIPPAVVACASQVFSMLLEDSSLVKKISANTKRFRSQMTAAGFTISGDDHPISPVMLGDAKLASDFADDMLGKSIFVKKNPVLFNLFCNRKRHLRHWIQLSRGSKGSSKDQGSAVSSSYRRRH